MQTSPNPDQTRFQTRFNLSAGKVFRRKDLADQHPSVDRELGRYVRSGVLRKAAQGLYYVPKTTPFGEAPPDDEALVAKFLDDKRFLVFNPSSYNTLGLGTTQLYNTTVVYNHKRHGKFMLAGFEFDFREKPHFPSADQVTREFLLVDMLNNLASLAEDTDAVLKVVQAKLSSFDAGRLQQAITDYASARTRRIFSQWVTTNPFLARSSRLSTSPAHSLPNHQEGIVMNHLDPATEQAVRRFITLMGGQFDTAGTIVYGSRARGTHRPDSDADVAVLLKGEHQRLIPTVLAMSDLAFDVLLETGINITPLPVWLDDWQHPERYSNPALLNNIAREGVPL